MMQFLESVRSFMAKPLRRCKECDLEFDANVPLSHAIFCPYSWDTLALRIRDDTKD